MRRILIFLLSLTVPIGFLMGAVHAIAPYQDDATVTLAESVGDVSRIEGKQVRQTVLCGENMIWECTYTAGEQDSLQTGYTFSQAGYEREFKWGGSSDVYFSVDGGSGVSSSGGIELKQQGVGIPLLAVADRTAPGETRTETVKLADYLDAYPMTYNANIFTDSYEVLEFYNVHEDAYADSVDEWDEHFRFPLLPEAEMEISLTKNELGEICDYHFYINDCPEIGFATHVVENGMYFAPYFLDTEGKSVTTGEYALGNGVYYIPFKPLGGRRPAYTETRGEFYEGTFDFDRLELVYPVEMADRIVAMDCPDGGSEMWVVTQEEGQYRYCVLDLTTGALTYQATVMPANAASVHEESCTFYPEDGVILLWSGADIGVLRYGEDPGVEFTCTLPEDVYMYVPDNIILEEGQLYMAGSGYGDLYIAVCDRNGLGFYGEYINSLMQVPHSYNGNFMEPEKFGFVK